MATRLNAILLCGEPEQDYLHAWFREITLHQHRSPVMYGIWKPLDYLIVIVEGYFCVPHLTRFVNFNNSACSVFGTLRSPRLLAAGWQQPAGA